MMSELYFFFSSRRRHTRWNCDWSSDVCSSDLEDFWYASFDGKKIETWIMKPVGFTPGKKYPLILNIHGGPHTAYGSIFFHEMQWIAAKGYVVVYPNPRESTTYGQDFGNVNQNK